MYFLMGVFVLNFGTKWKPWKRKILKWFQLNINNHLCFFLSVGMNWQWYREKLIFSRSPSGTHKAERIIVTYSVKCRWRRAFCIPIGGEINSSTRRRRNRPDNLYYTADPKQRAQFRTNARPLAGHNCQP